MNTTSASPADPLASGSPDRPAGASRRTVDAPTRTFHALLALCFTGAYLTGDSEHWRTVHVTLGYTLAGLLAFRLVWGLLGPKPVRWSSWAGKLRGLPGALAELRQGRVTGAPVQNQAMALVVIGLLCALALVTASGWLVWIEWTGDWMAEIHESIGEILLVGVVGHVALVVGWSLLRGRNLAAPMLSGKVPGRGPDLVTHNRRWLAGLLLAGVLGFWLFQFQQAPTPPSLNANTPSPTELWRGLSGLKDHEDDDHDD